MAGRFSPCPSIIILLLAACWPPAVGQARAERALPGPVAASVVRVIDGDSVELLAHVWPRHRMLVTVRLAGIDAPELRASCRAERQRAHLARDRLDRLLADRTGWLHDVSAGTFYGRVIARLVLDDGTDVSQWMLNEDLAVAYGEEPGANVVQC